MATAVNLTWRVLEVLGVMSAANKKYCESRLLNVAGAK